MFSVSETTLYNLINRNNIEKFKEGKFVYVPKTDLVGKLPERKNTLRKPLLLNLRVTDIARFLVHCYLMECLVIN